MIYFYILGHYSLLTTLYFLLVLRLVIVISIVTTLYFLIVVRLVILICIVTNMYCN